VLNDLEYLQEAYDQGLLVPFVGAGVSASVAGLPPWGPLLERGLAYAAAERAVDPADPRVADARALGPSRSDPGQWIRSLPG
jgi:hypothetical protein